MATGFLLLAGVMATMSVGQSAVIGGHRFIWIEAEQLPDLGGWKIDSQFIDQMGSSYLLAQGLHGPVEDASGEVNIPADGRWAVWVRTKNWCPQVETPPGRFTVIIGGHESAPLGTHKNDRWRWQRAGSWRLSAGRHKLRIHDLTGEYGRCDCILLTDDVDFIPPQDPVGYKDLRFKITGVDDNFRPAGEWDVVVVGGGLAGCFAAVAAARHGARTCLIQNRPVLGGNASTEITVGVGGASVNSARYSRESGLVEEGWREALRLGSWSAGLEYIVRAEPLLDLFLNTHATGVEMADDQTIAAVKARDVLTGQGHLFRGRIFIDCTGDACVGAAAGAEFRRGREGRDEFGESIAPEKPDKITLGTSLLFRARDAGHPVEFTPPTWAYKFRTCADLPHRDHSNVRAGYWWIEYGGVLDTVADAEKIRDELLRILYGVWDHIKNHCRYSDKARNLELAWVGYVGGKRESRRLVGDYILRQADLDAGRVFDDQVAYGGWPIDLHAPLGIFDPSPPATWHAVPLYSIPFRCLYSRNIANLMMAGRDISVTHVALGSTRLMATCGAEGQAVGTAAALCIKYDCSPRDVGRDHIRELQRLLRRDDAHLLDWPLREDDNLARRAQITASSFAASVPYDRHAIRPWKAHQCDVHDRAVRLPWRGGVLQCAWALLDNRTDHPLDVRLELRLADTTEEMARAKAAAIAQTQAPPGRHWVRFDFNFDCGDAQALWFVLPATKGLSWWLTDRAPGDAWRAWSPAGHSDWHQVGEVYALCTDPVVAMTEDCRPEKVADGFMRPRGTDFCGWVSAPGEKLPQWLELRWPEPQTVAQVEIVFDTNLDARWPRNLYEPEVVRDYAIEYIGPDGQWREIVRVTDNYDRLRVHRFSPIETRALRLRVLKTGGAPEARVFELRAYAQPGP